MNCPTDAKGAVVWFSNARQGGLSVFPGRKPGCLVFTSSLKLFSTNRRQSRPPQPSRQRRVNLQNP